MESLTTIKCDDVNAQTDDDKGFFESVGSSTVSPDERKTKSNSVIDSIGADFFLSPSSGTHPRQRSKSLSSCSGYYTSPEREKFLDKVDIATSDWIKKSDFHDARVNVRPAFDEENTFVTEPSSPSTSAAIKTSVLKDADCYNMNHKNRGKCVIFNHEHFDMGFDKREGSSTDAVKLEKSFGKLGFEVLVHNDLNHMEVMTEIDNLSGLDHTDNDCICIIVLTHGFHNDLICAKDAAYKSDKIWKPFTANRCNTLAGKPKLFFFQACRGDELDGGVVLSPRSALGSETDSVASYKIPTHADFLIAHSSVQGFYTWRNPIEGTWYIQCLCSILDEYGTELDLMSMLTMTARKVATEYASNNPDDTSMHDQKQVPSVTSMLIRSVYFPPKPNQT
ncbi:caspase-1-like [Pseudomyrmex gracilis]|uniref:caspase-1-like n=1 Tax=Pseudomyrmex gracilis TaxID=219809 RepID=UPI000994C8FF|nr:caspase-1-like [Pseudomyrmex gracilis]